MKIRNYKDYTNMKIIIALVLMVASVAATWAILAKTSNDQYKFSIKITKTEGNDNSNVALRLTVPSITSPMGSSHYATGACINTGSSSYTLTTTNNTLGGFGIEWQCNSACNSLESLNDTVKFYAGANWGLDTTGKASSSSSLIQSPADTGNNSVVESYKTSVYTIYNKSESELKNEFYFPNHNETWYMIWFAKFNHSGSVNLNSGITDLNTFIGNQKNVTVKGKSHQASLLASIVGVLAIFLA